MPSARTHLRLVTPRRTVTQRSSAFWLLLALPVIAGCVLALAQSETVTYLTEWPGEMIDGLIDQANQQLQRFRRS